MDKLLKINKGAKKVIDTLKENGYEAYIVGGAVRNLVIGIPVDDYDITTNALPDEVIALFSNYKTITMGRVHGTIGIVIDKETYEVTTYRTDGLYTDFRHPSSVKFGKSLEEDLLRRDFTINSLVYDNKIIDLFDGIKDIDNKIIRTIGNAKDRFNEDPLRILRALRFSSVLGFSIDKETKRGIEESYKLLEYISHERKIVEISKMIINSQNFSSLFEEYYFLFDYLFSLNYSFSQIEELKYAFLFNQSKEVEMCLSILLYYVEDLIVVLKNNKFSNHMKKSIINIVTISKKLTFNEKDLKFLLRDYDYNEVHNAIKIRSLINNKYNHHDYIEEFDCNRLLAFLESIKNDCFKLSQLAINGRALIEMGVSSSSIGMILNDLLDLVIEGKIKNNKKDLLIMCKELKVKYEKA